MWLLVFSVSVKAENEEVRKEKEDLEKKLAEKADEVEELESDKIEKDEKIESLEKDIKFEKANAEKTTTRLDRQIESFKNKVILEF